MATGDRCRSEKDVLAMWSRVTGAGHVKLRSLKVRRQATEADQVRSGQAQSDPGPSRPENDRCKSHEVTEGHLTLLEPVKVTGSPSVSVRQVQEIRRHCPGGGGG